MYSNIMFFFFFKKGKGKSLKDLTQEIKMRFEFYLEINWEAIGKWPGENQEQMLADRVTQT